MGCLPSVQLERKLPKRARQEHNKCSPQYSPRPRNKGDTKAAQPEEDEN